jgi:hypothetical protein
MFSFIMSLGVIGVVVGGGFAFSHAIDDRFTESDPAVPRD